MVSLATQDPYFKPEYGAELDPDYFQQRPALFFPCNEGGGSKLHDPSDDRITGTFNGGVTWAPSSKGLALSFTTSGLVTIAAGSPGIYPVAPFALMFDIAYTTTSNLVVWEVNGLSGFSIQTAAANLSGSGSVAGGLIVSVNFQSGANLGLLTSKSAWNDGRIHRAIISVPSYTNAAALFIDGVDDTGATHGATAPTYAGAPMYLGSRNGSFGFGGRIGSAGVLPYAPTPQQIADLYANPWGMFAPRTLRMAGRAVVGKTPWQLFQSRAA